MLKEWNRRRAAARVKPGDGRPLKPFRWWQLVSRVLFHLRLTGPGGRRIVYTVDVGRWGDKETGELRADLYLDGHHHARSKLPAVFPVEGGTVEVRMSAFGLKRCHHVTYEGTEHQLTPDRDSAEGRRARLDRAHPALSRLIGLCSLVMLLVSLAILVPQLVETALPPDIGTFDSPFDLPIWLNTAVTLGSLTAGTERALRLRYHWLLDGAAG
ncbi:hypothetical protein [Streptomyces niveus]|uniref:hypothetical protein n=1 Tax=Streptomyces niveus TaxID=193462 RepID=UPI0033DB6A18